MGIDLPEHIGPYRVTGRLGRGGMGEVLRGHDDRLDRPVALKRILPDVREPERALRRFRREARAVARLSHPAIVQVYDWEEHEGQHWLVMELAEGRPLDEVIAEGRLPPRRALEIARDIASGLAVAHDAGLVHRDLKTTNVIVTEEGPGRAAPGRAAPGRAKILDFGLAKAVRLEGSEADPAVPSGTLTGEGNVVGTVTAMSPEQAQGMKVDHRSDLFSLGILLYEMLSGVLPFQGGSAIETLTRICTTREEPLRRLDPEIPEGVSRLVSHLLEKDPARRPNDARQVVAEIDRLSSGSWETAVSESAAGQDTRTSLAALRAEGVRTKSRKALRTLLLSDLVDSTRLVERLGDQRAAEIFERNDRLARRLLAEHDGLEVDKSDGFLFLFNGPLAAVSYALDYHAELAKTAEREGMELATRIGIHVGEVVLRENPPEDVARGAKPLEVEGLAKATAARLMSLAQGRQTLISRGVYDMARRASVGADSLPEGLRWVSHGRYRVKGMEEPIEVFEVGVDGLAPLVAPPDSEKVARVVEGARVFPRLSWLAAAGVVVALVLWGLTSWPARVTQDKPAAGAPGASAPLPEAELNSYDLYRRGMTFLERYDRKGNVDKAIDDFQRALALDESYAPALAGLARAYWHDFYGGSQDPQRLTQALAAAERAVALDKHLAIAWASLGIVHFEMGQFAAATEELERALQIEPLNVDAWYGLGRISESQDQLQQAEERYLRAIDAQPGNWVPLSRLGSLYFRTGRYKEAETAFLHHVELTPDSFVALRNLGATYYMEGRLDEAATQFQEALQIQPDPTVYTNLGTIYFAQGLYAPSVSAFEKAIESGGSNDYQLWGNLGDAYRWTPDNKPRARVAYLRAIQLLRDKLVANPRDATVHTRLTLYLAKRGDCDQALAEIRMVGALSEDDGYAWFRLATANEVCGQRDDALAALTAALQASFPIEEVQRDPELLKLRQDVRYHRMVMELQQSTDAEP